MKLHSPRGQSYTASFDISLEGITVTPSLTPEIFGAAVSGKRLFVNGQNFEDGATLFMDGDRQKKTINDETNPSTMLVARKSGNKINAGQTVMLQVANLDGTLSNQFQYTRPS